MQKLLLLWLTLVVTQVAWTQIKVSEHAQLTYNKARNEFFVLDDSTFYWTQTPGSQKWIKHPFYYKGKESFAEIIKMTRVIPINKSMYYFVHESCGNVYALYKDTLKRIDQSFPHRNQYGAAMFPWRNSVYMFGGYGFFEVKDVFTRYVPKAREWFEVQVNSNERPSPRSGSAYILSNDELFLIGGVNRSYLRHIYLNDCWTYQFKSHKWVRKGELHEELVKSFPLMNLQMNLSNGVLLESNHLIEFDVPNNKWTLYSNPFFLNMNKVVTSADKRHLMYVLNNSNNLTREVQVQRFSQMKENEIGVYPIYQKISVFKLFPKEDYLYISLTLNFMLFILLFYIRRMHKLKFLQRAQKKLFKADFTNSEWEVLCLIQRHGEMELSALNEYFNEVGLSYETLKKRRETFVKSIRIKIALITRKPIEEILVESKHQVDKRMKIIHWNEDIQLENTGDSN
jgi:hypothetical protein